MSSKSGYTHTSRTGAIRLNIIYNGRQSLYALQFEPHRHSLNIIYPRQTEPLCAIQFEPHRHSTHALSYIELTAVCTRYIRLHAFTMWLSHTYADSTNSHTTHRHQSHPASLLPLTCMCTPLLLEIVNGTHSQSNQRAKRSVEEDDLRFMQMARNDPECRPLRSGRHDPSDAHGTPRWHGVSKASRMVRPPAMRSGIPLQGRRVLAHTACAASAQRRAAAAGG